MNSHPHVTTQDRPIESEVADQLDRGPFVASLVRALVVEDRNDKGRQIGLRATGYVVGLTGRWGLGKSSVINLLAKQLHSMDNVTVAIFNPWLFNGRDELFVGFFNTLREAMGNSSAENVRDLVESIDRYKSAINVAGRGVAAVVDLHGGSGAATAVWSTWWPRLQSIFKKPKSRTTSEEKRSLENKIKRSKCAIVVLIDELDRIEDDDVRAVAQLVKAIGDIKGVSYLVAYDHDRVVQALGRGNADERIRSGEHYLEKIIQHPIPLRPLFDEDKRALLEAALADHNVNLAGPSEDSHHAILEYIIEAIKTPREVKRLIGSFSVLASIALGEVCLYDVLGYCWILTKSPGLRDKISAHFDQLVSDPSEALMFQRAVRSRNNEADDDVADILGESGTAHHKIIKLLFPHLENESKAGEGDRICWRRNLIRILYLGNPPGAIRRGELEDLWSNTDLNLLEVSLRIMIRKGKFSTLLDRLDDLVHLLPEKGHTTFWVALSRALHRNSDWLTGPEANRTFADDAAAILGRLGRRNPAQKRSLLAAIDALVRIGDLILVPTIVRQHLFAHGLNKDSDGPRGGDVLNVQETQDLLARELPRYRTSVLDGTALRRLPNLEAVFVIVNSGYWDCNMRLNFTSQLDTLDAILTFAALIVPPGSFIPLFELNKVIDASIVRERIEIFATNGTGSIDPWLSESLNRLRNTLDGKDPHTRLLRGASS